MKIRKTLVNVKIFFALIHDLAGIAFCWIFAFGLRFDFNIPIVQLNLMWSSLPIILFIYMFVFLSVGLYRASWRFASILDLKRIFKAIIIGSTVISAGLLIVNLETKVPRSVLLLQPVLLILIMSGSRLTYRVFKERQLFGTFLNQGQPVVLIGAGSAALSLLRSFAKNSDWHVVALLDDDKSLWNREIFGVKVHGSLSDLDKVKSKFNVKHVIVAIPSASYYTKRKVLDHANALEMKVFTVPSVEDLMSGRLNISQIRPVNVDNLLRRDPVNLDISGLKDFLFKKTVMVTGGGGSIGSELCKQILSFKPSQLICFDISEFALYNLEQKLMNLNYKIECIYILGDIKNQIRLEEILKTFSPEIIFHTAAYKHVPMMEQVNVSEAVLNNAFGTYILAQAAKKNKVEKFILVSTDKAVNPSNIMGASKRLAEIICQTFFKDKGTIFIIVRFGNVLGSSGSVVPKFEEQIKNGGPVTITHPKITRFFMSIPEAAQLVIQAGLIGKKGDIFILDMGKPIKILDLAKDMISLAGKNITDIDIKFTGLRPGEKLYEELFLKNEKIIPTKHEKLYTIQSKNFDQHILFELLKWFNEIKYKKDKVIKKEIRQWVPEYTPDLDLR